ncbi:MAG: hypothetical protein HQL20_03250 [Candidatus Omnitrophica bacterium]|nr:hypothetical protein [Candidatus Omnitrophota bacterium]
MWSYSDVKVFLKDFRRYKWASVLVVSCVLIGLSIISWMTNFFGEKGKQSATNNNVQILDNRFEVGNDSVVMGNVSSGKVGNRSVVVGPTDNRGNVNVNQSGAYGYGAHAGPGSIAIGAYAGAGSTDEDNKKNGF